MDQAQPTPDRDLVICEPIPIPVSIQMDMVVVGGYMDFRMSQLHSASVILLTVHDIQDLCKCI